MSFSLRVVCANNISHRFAWEAVMTTQKRPVKGADPQGFDPYNGALPQRPVARKKDLRKLGEWIEAKRKAEAIKQGNR